MITVYWAASSTNSSLSRSVYLPPVPQDSFNHCVFTHNQNNFLRCPSFRDHTRNQFKILWPFDWQYEISSLGLHAQGDQRLLDGLISVREPESRLMGFNLRYVFFCEQSLTMSQTAAYLDHNRFTRSTTVIPGEFDIAQWFRNTDLAFTQHEDSMQLNQGDAVAYVKFHTREPIRLQRFELTDQLEQIQRDLLASKITLLNSSPAMDWYYDLFKRSSYRNRIIRLIKENLL